MAWLAGGLLQDRKTPAMSSAGLDTAQKVVVGAALLAKVRKPEEVQLRAWLLQFLKAEVTRQADVTRILPLINELEALPEQ